MGRVHVVVDGSNIATEGRTTPSLAQLDDAVRAFVEHYNHDKVTVIVDATFGHRIDASEVAAFEEAILAGELVTPPAGTIGRGDAFILEVARRADADVLSNDSFQELHAEHPWLFEAGRLWGGKPVPNVGWVFVPRAPVRGITSRRAVQAKKRASKAAQAAAKAIEASDVAAIASEAAAEAASAVAGAPTTRRRRRATKAPEPTAPAAAPPEPEADAAAARRRRRRGEVKREPVNEPLVYAAFVVEHPVGTAVPGTVERFSSHGAYVRVAGAAAYVPLRMLGDPPPRSAREVLSIGETRDFTVARFDPTIRGIDVVPTDIAALTTSALLGFEPEGAEAAAVAVVPSETDAEEAPVPTAAKKTAARKATAKKATAKKTTARKATAKKATAKKTTARKAPARKTTAKKATARKSAAKKAPARKKAAAKKAPARKKAAAKKATARRTSAAKKR